MAEDPTLDADVWESSVTEFHDVIVHSGVSFGSFLDEGLLDEPGDAREVVED